MIFLIDRIVVWYGSPWVQSPDRNKGTVLLHISLLEYFSWVNFSGARNCHLSVSMSMVKFSFQELRLFMMTKNNKNEKQWLQPWIPVNITKT